jgi:hypothetical protein
VRHSRPELRVTLESKLQRTRRSCGCVAGFLGLCAAVVAGIAYYGAQDAPGSGILIRVVSVAGFGLAGALSAKLVALAWNRYRVRALQLRIAGLRPSQSNS